MSDTISSVAQAAKADAQKFWGALKGAAANPRWLLSSKFFMAFAGVLGLYLLADHLPVHIAYSVAFVIGAFLYSRSAENVATTKAAVQRTQIIAELVVSGKLTVEAAEALNKALGG